MRTGMGEGEETGSRKLGGGELLSPLLATRCAQMSVLTPEDSHLVESTTRCAVALCVRSSGMRCYSVLQQPFAMTRIHKQC